MPYLFGYASLVDRMSLEASLGRSVPVADGPYPARLLGFRRCWNVAVHSRMRPDYEFHDGHGSPWQGWIVFLGIEPSPADVTLGAAYRVTDADLLLLDRRELSYHRTDIGDRLDRRLPGVGDEPVFTYVSTPEVCARALEIGTRGTVMARYLRLVDRAFRTLGENLYAEHLTALPALEPYAVDEITGAPRDPLVRNEVVDPAPGPRGETGA